MKQDRILRIYGFIHAWLLMAAAYLLFLSFFEETTPEKLLQTVYFILPVVSLYWIRIKGRGIGSYLLLTGLFLFGGWMTGKNTGEKTGMLLFTGILAAGYFADRIRKTQGFFCRPEYPFLGFFLIISFYSSYGKEEFLGQAVLAAGMGYFLLVLWAKNREEFLKLRVENQNLYRFPEKSILKNNRLILFLTTILTLAGMLLMPFLGLQQGLVLLVKKMGIFLGWILSLLAGKEEKQEMIVSEKQNHFLPDVSSGEIPEFLKDFFAVMEKILTVAVILGLAAGLFYLICYLYRKYREGECENGDLLEQIKSSDAAKRERLKKGRPFAEIFHRLTIEEKIRRYYRKQIRKYQKIKPTGTETPEELEEHAGMKKSMQRDRIHCIYEKARYSNLSCSRQEEREMKQADSLDFS